MIKTRQITFKDPNWMKNKLLIDNDFQISMEYKQWEPLIFLPAPYFFDTFVLWVFNFSFSLANE